MSSAGAVVLDLDVVGDDGDVLLGLLGRRLVQRDELGAGTGSTLGFIVVDSGCADAAAARVRGRATWKVAPHFGQMIGSLFRSKNLAPQLWHWRLLPSSGLAT